MEGIGIHFRIFNVECRMMNGCGKGYEYGNEEGMICH